jgi:hypothetical protein
MDEYKVARVHWLDASFHPGWHSSDEMDAIASDGCAFESVGWLVKDEPDYVVLAMSVGKTKAGELLKIPRAYIKEMFINEG